MPFVRLYDLPNRLQGTAALILLMRETIPQRVAAIPELGITADDVRVVAAADLIESAAGCEISGEILLKEKPVRTEVIQWQAANAVAMALDEFADQHIPNCRIIEILPRTFREEQLARIVRSTTRM